MEWVRRVEQRFAILNEVLRATFSQDVRERPEGSEEPVTWV